MLLRMPAELDAEHLSLSYQMEVLYSQAVAVSQSIRRGQLTVEMDRPRKVLILKYWV